MVRSVRNVTDYSEKFQFLGRKWDRGISVQWNPLPLKGNEALDVGFGQKLLKEANFDSSSN